MSIARASCDAKLMQPANRNLARRLCAGASACRCGIGWAVYLAVAIVLVLAFARS